MALGAFIYICETLYKRRVAKRIDGAGPPTNGAHRPRPPNATAPPVTMYVVVRRDNKAWAGPWHNNGTTFSTVPARWYRYKTAAEAQHEVDTNDFLRHCTVEEDS